MMRRCVFVLALMMCSTLVYAQHPFILTESAQTLGAKIVQVGIGAEYFEKRQAPDSSFAVSEIRLFTTSLHFGVAENVDFNLDWRGRLLAKRSDGAHVSDWGDMTVATKIRLYSEETAPFSLAICTSVKLPNTSYLPNKLGSDATDFFCNAVASKKYSCAEMRLNLGLGILDSPINTGEQDDIYMYSAAMLVPISSSTHFFTEFWGFTGHLADDNKLLIRYGITQNLAGIAFNLYASSRIIGNNTDYATAFDASENWSIGILLKKDVQY